MSNRSSAPLFGTVNVTSACNLDCVYCFMQPRSNEFITEADFRHVVHEMADLHLFFINISGGEPFLHPQITEFLGIAHEAFQKVMVLSNGTILKPEHIRAIQRIIHKKGAFTIQVSLDSVFPEVNDLTRGRCDTVLNNVRTLTALGAHVIIATVVTNRNAAYVEDTMVQLSPYTRFFHLMTVQNIRSRDGIEAEYGFADVLQGKKSFWERIRALGTKLELDLDTPSDPDDEGGCAAGAPCMAAFSHVVVDPSLRVRPCDRLTDIEIGDLRKSRLAVIWESDAARAITNCRIPLCRIGRNRTGSAIATISK